MFLKEKLEIKGPRGGDEIKWAGLFEDKGKLFKERSVERLVSLYRSFRRKLGQATK